MTERPVLLLNASYEPLNVTSVRRAVGLLYLDKAQLLHTADGLTLRSERDTIAVPSVVRLNYYVRHRRSLRVPLTKRNVYRRDRHSCQYCGARERELTLDHVVPRVRGGSDNWDNLVASCKRCNSKKGDRTPAEAGMSLRSRPSRPGYFGLLVGGLGAIDKSWRSYLYF